MTSHISSPKIILGQSDHSELQGPHFVFFSTFFQNIDFDRISAYWPIGLPYTNFIWGINLNILKYFQSNFRLFTNRK